MSTAAPATTRAPPIRRPITGASSSRFQLAPRWMVESAVLGGAVNLHLIGLQMKRSQTFRTLLGLPTTLAALAFAACGGPEGGKPAPTPADSPPPPCIYGEPLELAWTDEVAGLPSPAAVLASLNAREPMDVRYIQVPFPPSRAVVGFTPGSSPPTIRLAEEEQQATGCRASLGLKVSVRLSLHTDDGALAEDDLDGSVEVYIAESFEWSAGWTRGEMRGALAQEAGSNGDVFTLFGLTNQESSYGGIAWWSDGATFPNVASTAALLGHAP